MFWEEQDRINQALIPRVVEMRETLEGPEEEISTLSRIMASDFVRAVADSPVRELRQRIEEIITVDQTEEQAVRREITEYVMTDHLRDECKVILTARRNAQSASDEGIGVWISGFFGSGKAFFAKNVGYILGNCKEAWNAE